ncbi:chitinase [Microbacterium caowuchunii]|uniref:Glycosyl hydrolase family 18 n=1 Tax=Microbacterium caowuchunii TaxID=2614638 RepID=A0A5N0TJE5_9MICO|nr:carbohydrate-binding protein [Microbacterium caowuchunii]KAA9134584.1 glycosyl hydrolase family 18 [Microbacterium caowuchunii]
MSPLTGRPGSRHAGKRFSFGRLAASLVITTLVIGGGVAAATVPLWLLTPTPAEDTRWFGGYYDATLESGLKLADDTVGGAPGNTVLSFIVAAAADDCTPTWGVAYDLDDAQREFELDRRIERMRQEGERIVVSFGGAINTELASACTSVSELSQAYRTVIDRYGVDTIDLDIEGEALTDTTAGTRRATAVARLQQERRRDGGELEVWVTLPVMPYGLTETGLAAVTQLLEHDVELAGVNVMTMNYGMDLGGRSMGEAAIDALDATADQLTGILRELEIDAPPGGVWSMLGATPMIGRNDVSGEILTIDDARTLSAMASERGLARMSMWSLNRDRTCGTNYSNPAVVSIECSGVEQAGESFAAILAEGYPDPKDSVDARPNAEAVLDDAETSPYPIWSSTSFYSAGVKVVWRGGVYVAEWWNQDGPTPDDPTIDVAASPWTYIGPVLEDDVPFVLPTLPEGTFPEWSADTVYQQGDRVIYRGTGYEAKWWSEGAVPDRSVLDRDYSPWFLVTTP